MVDWDDLRFFRAIVQHASIRGAATALGVNPSTVTRRLDALETSLGTHLFARSQNGLHLTSDGEDVARRATTIAEAIGKLERATQGRDQRLQGVVRLAAPELVARPVLVRELVVFKQRYPDIDLQVQDDDERADLMQGVFDVVLRLTDKPPESMVGRRIGETAIAAYGASDFVATSGVAASDADTPWVRWTATSELAQRCDQLQQSHFPEAVTQVKVQQAGLYLTCIKGGQGVGMLPCFLGEQDPTLTRLPQMRPQSAPPLWMLAHPDLRSTRRVQVVLEFVRELFVAQADILGSGLPQGALT